MHYILYECLAAKQGESCMIIPLLDNCAIGLPLGPESNESHADFHSFFFFFFFFGFPSTGWTVAKTFLGN